MDEYDQFEQDWADATGGNWTFDELSSGQDITGNMDVSGMSNYIDMSQYGTTEITNPALPGQEGYGWRYFSDGTAISPSGQYFANNPETGKTEMVYDPSGANANIVNQLLKTAKSAFTKKNAAGQDVIDWAALGTAGVGLYSLWNESNKEGGYNKPVPKMDMVREQVQYDDANRVPGSAGRQYFTDPRFVAQGDTAALDAAKTASAEQAAGLKALQPSSASAPTNPWAGKMKMAWNPSPVTTDNAAASPVAINSANDGALQTYTPPPPRPVNETGMPIPLPPAAMAHGGIAELARGGRYLSGATDGMADKIDTSIDGQQPAKLSHGEFVIPADVVSHLGNGNSDAGAQKLYQMMARVRKARTGNPEQGKRINPDKYMPGGIVGLATGGEVKGFNGTTGSAVNNTATGAGGVPLDTSRTSTLSPWVGDYVTNALGQGAALAAAPYQAYTGPLTAGASNLQQQAFAGSSELAQAGYNPTQYTAGTFDAGAAQRYMNPYLQASLDPQLKELQRQNQIANMTAAGQLVKAGAFGGGRQAVMNAENQRNMLDKTNELLSQGYATAYDKAMAQFNADQARQMEAEKASEASRQYSSDFGLKSLQNLANMGATERDIAQQGIAADKAQFEEQRDWAYKMPQYQLNLLANLPIGAQTTSTDQDTLSAILSKVSGLGSLYQQLSNLGQAPATTTTTAK